MMMVEWILAGGARTVLFLATHEVQPSQGLFRIEWFDMTRMPAPVEWGTLAGLGMVMAALTACWQWHRRIRPRGPVRLRRRARWRRRDCRDARRGTPEIRIEEDVEGLKRRCRRRRYDYYRFYLGMTRDL